MRNEGEKPGHSVSEKMEMQAAGKGENRQMTAEKIRETGILEDGSKKAILVVSFGTSYKGQRRDAIGAVERAVSRAFPGWEIRRAFTSQMIINHLREEEGEWIDNVEEALKRLLEDGYRVAAVQPTHVMNGLEYDKMIAAVSAYADQFDILCCGKPLLNSSRDYERTAEALAGVTGKFQGSRTAVVCMGHGTEHEANQVYGRMESCFKELGMTNFLIGTVEARPSLEDVLAKVQSRDYERVILLPLMIVAGDHANHDMAGEKDSWREAFEKNGYRVECILRGMGEYSDIQEIFVEHVRQAVEGWK